MFNFKLVFHKDDAGKVYFYVEKLEFLKKQSC